MNWIKKGLVFNVKGNYSWNKTHAQVPTPILISNNLIRVYYTSRDQENKSHISFIDVSAKNPLEIIYEHDEPVLSPGPSGTFDDCGVMCSWAIKHEKEIYLYYIGWNVRNTVPYYNAVGLAISKNEGRSFTKISEGPLWDRDIYEPFFSASTCVIKEDGFWRNWYLSCTGYKEVLGKMEPRYHIKYAESNDGIHWVRNGVIAIDYKNDFEAGIVKASVVKHNSIYKMWYSHRNFVDYRTDSSNSYKIGYAESYDGIIWTRLDSESGISLSAKGWDSKMIEYPHVIASGEKFYLFYNGNQFGQSGFGLAETYINNE